MRKSVILVTGSSGEIGHSLVWSLSRMDGPGVLALDIQSPGEELRDLPEDCIQGSILDKELLARINSRFEILAIHHLAALLSTRAEFTPDAAHRVNVEGTMNLLELAMEQSRWQGRSVPFLFPSSIAVYGLPSLEAKRAAGAVKEHEWMQPITMYGCNKLYCEHLGRYFTHHYRQLAADREKYGVDFRAIRFPGLISAFTVPTGGTSDYAPEMLHAAARGRPYACFVRPDTRIPFMAMPDATKALLSLQAAPRESLRRTVYNVTSFSISAGEFAELVQAAFPGAEITFEPDLKRQGIVDSWPEDADDSAAREDWGWAPDYDLRRAFDEYLLPHIRKRYAG
jgi:nucleoside-diphosphate-sugar epimerase